jgi:tRNA pseudouridine13 synthase
VVDEIPLYPASGSGAHRYLRVEKRDMTTPELVRVIAACAGVSERDVGYAGLKDKHAVTTQWISLPDNARPTAAWQLPEAVRVLEETRHDNKLRTGHQEKNRFSIRLVDVAPGALSRARAVVAALLERGLPNYFGSQRFGHGGRNLELARGWLSSLVSEDSGRAGRRAPRRHFQNKLYSSVLQAEVFNRYLTARLEAGASHLLAGEVVRLHGSRSVFVVGDPEKEQARLGTGDIHLTGPIFGPRCRAAEPPAVDLENAALASLELSSEALLALGKHAAGSRRDLLVQPEDLEVFEEELNRLVLRFALPSGSYATQLVRELTHQPFLQAAGVAHSS